MWSELANAKAEVYLAADMSIGTRLEAAPAAIDDHTHLSASHDERGNDGIEQNRASRVRPPEQELLVCTTIDIDTKQGWGGVTNANTKHVAVKGQQDTSAKEASRIPLHLLQTKHSSTQSTNL